MSSADYFSVAERVREKEQSRARDELRIANGEVDAQKVGRQNGLYCALDRDRIRIVRRRAKVNISA
jgi:hypothetical protein